MAPFVDTLSLTTTWMVAFPKRADQAATIEHMRVVSLVSARSKLAKASR